MILPKPNDNYIISYPKCGRTWIRALLGKFLYLNFDKKQRNNDYILDTASWHKDITDINEIWFSHDKIIDTFHLNGSANDMSNDKTHYKDTKVIFLYRDPRDVLISYYFHKNRRKKKKSRGYVGCTLEEYIHNEKGAIECIIRFYNIWYEQRNIPRDFMLLRYEYIKEDVNRELKRLLEFFDVDIKYPNAITASVEFSSFKNMQSREKNKIYKDKTFCARNISDIESFKVRKGKVEGYKHYLSDKHIDYLNEKMKKLNPYFGYKV